MNNDLISRQAAIDEVGLNTWAGSRISRLPIIDAVPIVRCKDCKHYQFADNRAFGMPVKICEWFGFEDVDDDDFCSRAERRDDVRKPD